MSRDERLVIEKSEEGEPAVAGEWIPHRHRERDPSAIVFCPMCERPSHLGGHEIDEDGVVSPSVDCAWDECPFHDWIRLEDWPPPKLGED